MTNIYNCFRFFILFLSVSSLRAQDFSATEVRALTGYNDYVFQTRFSPYGNYISVTIGDNTVELYDRNYRKLWSSQGDFKSVGGRVAFSPDEKYLAFTKHKTDHDIGVLRLSDLKVIQTMSEQDSYLNGIAFSPDGRFLVSGSDDYSVHVWKWDNEGFKDHYELVKYTNQANAVAFSPDGSLLVTGFQDGTIKIFQLKGDVYREFQTIEGNKYSIEALDFHPSGKYFVSGGSDFAVRIFSKEGSNFKPGKVFTDEWGSVNELSFSPDGKYLAGAKSNSQVKIWKMEGMDFALEKTLSRHTSYTFDVDFSSDGRYLSSSSHDRSAVIYELKGVGPSAQAFIQENFTAPFTGAQRKVIGGYTAEKILAKADKALTGPKDEFETNQEYQKRKEKLKAQLLLLLQQETEVYFKGVKGKANISFAAGSLEGYDADHQTYALRFLEAEGKITIPVAEARSLKESWQKAKVTAVKNLSPDGISYTYGEFTLIHPVSGKTYQISLSENPFNPGSSQVGFAGQEEKDSNDIEDPAPFDKRNVPGVNYALLFATNDYENYPDLVNPVHDGRTIARELEQHYHFKTEIVENPSLEQVVATLRTYAQKQYNPRDQLFIFFAGHGKYDEVFKEGYLVAKESRQNDETKTTLLSHSNLRTIINNIPNEHIFLIMDVCFGGTFDPHIASRGTDVYSNITKSEFIERKLAHKTRLYLTSGGKEYVPDGRPGEHSPFVRKFLEALRSYGGEDGILTTGEIFNYVDKVVPQPRIGEFGNNEPGSDFIFVAK